MGRCSHCFREKEEDCQVCKQEEIPFARASVFEFTPSAQKLIQYRPDLVGEFAILQFAELDWPIPDVIIPMSSAFSTAKKMADLLKVPFANVLQRGGVEALNEDQIILLVDHHSPFSEVREAISSLLDAFPKKGFLLSLFPYDIVL